MSAADAVARSLTRGWVLAAALALAFFWQLGSLPLFDVDEGAFSEATREMLESGNFVSPTQDGQPRHDKPVLIYWLQAASVTALGLDELALRLPSAIAAVLWAIVVWRFARRRVDTETAAVAALVMVLGLQVGLIGKGAIADAVLNLFLALTLFEIHDYAADPRRSTLLRVYLWMGLAFLTKGPVAVALPFVVSLIWLGSLGRWRDWLGAVFAPAGWVVFLIVVVPWHVAVYLDQGTAFFEGFYLKHNVARYSTTMEGHGGHVWYYVVAAPLVVMPFAGWLISLFAGLRADWADPLRRFLWIWFAVVFALFSFSSTQLPHYLLYGCTPLFVLMAMRRDDLRSRWLAYLPPLVLLVALALLPELLGVAARHARRLHEQEILAAGIAATSDAAYRVGIAAAIAAVAGLAVWRGLAPWRGLLLVGFVQLLVVSGLVLPRYASVVHAPVKEAAAVARGLDVPVVAYRIDTPSFSVYRNAITPARLPRPGEVALTRVDRLDDFDKKLPGVPREEIFRRAAVVLVRFLPPAPKG
ncbi:MAG: glycosyltransferase family 39 protein [Gammaproteobacteria bacterium]|jgi:4-amino-4-deoxy-L-arabinose transferase-like glycosyltransferase|nr:glycosyltransferase family 39 protein [Gammaproteobacteria bacterium]